MTYVLGASAAVTAGLGLYKAIKGGGEVADAKRRAKLNIRPTYDIQKQYYDNNNLASSMAQNGLSDAERNYYNTNAERGLSSGIGAALQTGGGPNAVGGLYDSFLRGQGAIANTSDQLKTQKLATLMQTNRELADQETNKWALDKYEPFKDEAKAIAGEKTAGQQGVNDGLNTVAGAVSSFAGSRTKFEDQPGGAASSITMGDKTGSAPIPEAVSGGVTMPTLSNQIPSDAIDTTRKAAVSDIMDKYKDSPYADGLYNYLNPVN